MEIYGGYQIFIEMDNLSQSTENSIYLGLSLCKNRFAMIHASHILMCQNLGLKPQKLGFEIWRIEDFYLSAESIRNPHQ